MCVRWQRDSREEEFVQNETSNKYYCVKQLKIQQNYINMRTNQLRDLMLLFLRI